MWKEEKEEEVAVSEKKGGSQKKPRGGSQKEEERHLFSLSPSPLSFFLSSCQPLPPPHSPFVPTSKEPFAYIVAVYVHAVSRTRKRLSEM